MPLGGGATTGAGTSTTAYTRGSRIWRRAATPARRSRDSQLGDAIVEPHGLLNQRGLLLGRLRERVVERGEVPHQQDVDHDGDQHDRDRDRDAGGLRIAAQSRAATAAACMRARAAAVGAASAVAGGPLALQSRGYLTFDGGDAQFRAARTGIGKHFLIAGNDGFAGQRMHARILAEEQFDDAVFERVKADDGDAAARAHDVGGGVEARAQRAQLVVDRDPQRLEGFASRDGCARGVPRDVNAARPRAPRARRSCAAASP